MVEYYLERIYPLWFIADGLDRRDASAWTHHTLAEAALNLIGVLAGLNQRCYWAFELKRTRRFPQTLSLAPDDVACRIDQLFSLERASDIGQLEMLVRETVRPVQQHMPEADTTVLRHQPGERQLPWTLSAS